MSMTKSSRTELRTLREVAHFLLPLVCCEFCGEPLLDLKLADKVFGNKTHSPLKFLKLTTHHRNGKHRDNTGGPLGLAKGESLNRRTMENKWKGLLTFAISGNKSLTHRHCHSEYEMTLSHKKKGLKKVKPIRERALSLIKQINGKTEDDATKAAHIMTGAECSFVVHLKERLKNKSRKVTRYEIRRLKKLSAKVEGRSVKTKSKHKGSRIK